ncbi:MAG TPA: lipopolysaccharide heptosyltransferase family protein [Aquifex aeolicus]|uniref:Lipopolysaccharide heptosyltransferase family protein n=1 Tax=Aquifex aeolicus TaxID=63363 RepID=A0A9D0YQN2_AQUAO|nr:lipopolysaccharide heptosyltransferase family protein [Aquificales bacterium]HIP98209.1 lipopolysaccharide heptosyltransferase family protein [Aquifex aeolicus]HIQ25816.1 lipopolysaccharide heptosyltransferase family protein [Aquifex aeolicus]
MSRKVLLIRFSSLGDVVLTSCLIEPFIKNGYKPILLTYRPYGELFSQDNRIGVIEVDKNTFRSIKKFFQLLEFLKETQPFAVIDLHANFKSFLVRKLLPAEVKTVYDKKALFRRFCVFLNRLGLAERFKYNPLNVLHLYTQTLGVLGLKVENPRPFIKVSPQSVEETLKKFSLKRGDYAVLGIGARYRKKEYPHFEELIKLLSQRLKVVLIGDKRDYEKSKDWKGVLNLCGKLSLIESLWVLKGAKVFVGNDSGATHMARAVGTPAVVIYGGTHPCLGFAPSPNEGIVISKNLSCSPCDLHGKGICNKNYDCLEIPPAEIAQKVFNMILK